MEKGTAPLKILKPQCAEQLLINIDLNLIYAYLGS